MSQRNGDRARFHRLRKRKILLRKATRVFRKTQETGVPGTEIAAAK